MVEGLRQWAKKADGQTFLVGLLREKSISTITLLRRTLGFFSEIAHQISFVWVNVESFWCPSSFRHSGKSCSNTEPTHKTNRRTTGASNYRSDPHLSFIFPVSPRRNNFSSLTCGGEECSVQLTKRVDFYLSASEENYQNGGSLNRSCVWVQSLCLDSSKNTSPSWPALAAAGVRTEPSQEQIWINYFWCENRSFFFFQMNERIKTQEGQSGQPPTPANTPAYILVCLSACELHGHRESP